MDTAMMFERTFRLLFGDKAYHIANHHGSADGRRDWLRKAIRRFTSDVSQIDTTVHHKEMLMAELAAIEPLLTSQDTPSWSLVYRLVRLTSRLLGYAFDGARCHTVEYWQSVDQNVTSVICRGGDAMQDYEDKRNAIKQRRLVVQHLKAQGLSDYTIGLVLNTTEYQVKKLRNSAQLERSDEDAL